MPIAQLSGQRRRILYNLLKGVDIDVVISRSVHFSEAHTWVSYVCYLLPVENLTKLISGTKIRDQVDKSKRIIIFLSYFLSFCLLYVFLQRL